MVNLIAVSSRFNRLLVSHVDFDNNHVHINSFVISKRMNQSELKSQVKISIKQMVEIMPSACMFSQIKKKPIK